ncbi:hypothetical protein [Flavobacterium magnum]|nr:hypothetical protein [Flavobacterium magnum]
MKEMAKASEGEKPNEKKAPVKEAELLFFQDTSTLHFAIRVPIRNPGVNTDYSNLYAYLDCRSDFHPPNFTA